MGIIVDYNEFLQILNRPDGWRPAGTEGKSRPSHTPHATAYPASPLTHADPLPVSASASSGVSTNMTFTEEFIKGFQVFDKTGKGLIGAGELRYVLTQLGEKMSDAEVDELLKGVATV